MHDVTLRMSGVIIFGPLDEKGAIEGADESFRS